MQLKTTLRSIEITIVCSCWFENIVRAPPPEEPDRMTPEPEEEDC